MTWTMAGVELNLSSGIHSLLDKYEIQPAYTDMFGKKKPRMVKNPQTAKHRSDNSGSESSATRRARSPHRRIHQQDRSRSRRST
jgi:hypothetical protein